MKTLRQSLIDYEIALLKAIADCRAVSLNVSGQTEAVNQLADALLYPVNTAIILGDLSGAEEEALQFLLENGGQIEVPRFTRRYGVIRSMGPARLERERPWQNPANPAEGLWYRGLIFKAFQVAAQGGREMVYIPDDLLPLLTPAPAPAVQSPKTLQVALSPTPAFTLSGQGRLRENFFSLLVFLQTTPIRLQNKTELPAKARQALTECLLPPFLSTFTPAAELELLLHLGQRADLLTIAHGRLRPERDAIRNWLQADPAQQVQLLQNTWRADPTWNDLWQVPGLVPQPTGWENSPLLARSKILGYLEQIDAPAGEWLSLDNFVAAIKRLNPDFQRPDGDYQSWYIQDADGNSLMGFEHWDKVDGALIRFLLTHILPLLGAVDLGCPAETGHPTAFCLTPLGEAFLLERPFTPTRPKKPVFLRVENDFYVRVPAQASLYDRFQLARFAELDRRENKRVVYHISRTSISRAAKNGVTADQITAFLTRATNNQIPLKVVETLRTWGARFATVKFEQATLLRLKDEQLMAELRQHPALSPLLGEVLNPTAILIPTKNIPKVRRLLVELGYLE